ncbi:hypothetical protein QQX98_012757 [Neonectria punicea]|uniref:Aminoglycoside phosphotransferase domain-containing protein n=1 Tax=Neonectria punicea TaxID=979145 RepID=A0ABR1GHX4_9HYPO
MDVHSDSSMGENPTRPQRPISSGDNIILERERNARIALYRQELWEAKLVIEAVAHHHLGLTSGATCRVMERTQWLGERFNVCIPIEVQEKGAKSPWKVLFKCPIPVALGEDKYPGAVDEKIRAEVGSHVYMRAHCPEIPLPELYGFGFPNGNQFTHVSQLADIGRFSPKFWHFFEILVSGALNGQLIAPYAYDDCFHKLPFGYLLVEYIDASKGQPLANNWGEEADNLGLQNNLHCGIAKLMLSLASLPQERIGSYWFNDDLTVTLSGRPLICAQTLMEANGAGRIMPPNGTHSLTSSFISDVLDLHNNRFVSHVNSVSSEEDCYNQMGIMALLRTVAHLFINRDVRNGPFCLQLPELDLTHIFVDSEWNITHIVDLEWMASLPVEMLQEPHWLTGLFVAKDDGQYTTDEARGMFMEVFAHYEQIMGDNMRLPVSPRKMMNEMWNSKGIWLYNSLMSADGMYDDVSLVLLPRFVSITAPELKDIVAPFWAEDVEAMVAIKVAHREQYVADVTTIFRYMAGQEGGAGNTPDSSSD